MSRIVFFLLLPALLSIMAGEPAVAQTEEEMAVLQMFYKEKDLVVSPTRHAKPITQVAENITVITAKEIERMNAHTVAEVLNRIPGFFIGFNQDFGAASLLQMQGAPERHTLVLVDGVPWNFLNSGHAETNTIPVGIIDKIEVIKGPASSAWGSSLGGVVNIITKQPGTTVKPTGSLRTSGGEKSTQDHRFDLAGKAGPVGYYAYSGYQSSKGLGSSRNFDSYSLYTKLEVPFSSETKFGMSMGYSEPDMDLGSFPSGDIRSNADSSTFFTTVYADARLANNFSIRTSAYHFGQKFSASNDALGLGLVGLPGERFLDTDYDEETNGGECKLIWGHSNQTAVLGVDYNHGNTTQTLKSGTYLRSLGVSPRTSSRPDRTSWALYANDTILLGRWSITPGIRYDDDNTGSLVSPSLGVTYRVNDNSLLRAAAARGFSVPPLAWTSGGGLFLDPNPNLDQETVWSYQVGAETGALKYLWLKATFFRHEVSDTIEFRFMGGGPPAFNDILVNGGDSRRQGFELEAETLPFWNFSLLAGLCHVFLNPSAADSGSDHLYKYTAGLRYDDKKSLQAELFGHYVWWDFAAPNTAKYDDFICDLNLIKTLYARDSTHGELFLTAHNLFNGSLYTSDESKNPRRWIEGGFRVRF